MSGDRGARVRIRRSRAIGVVMLVGISVAACGVPADGGRRGELRGWVIDTPVPKPDLTLTDTNGEAFDLRAETEGYLTLVFFGGLFRNIKLNLSLRHPLLLEQLKKKILKENFF